MNKIIKSKYSFSQEYLRKANMKISDIFVDIKNDDVLIINDNNLFGYIEIIKEAKKYNINNILLTYHINPNKNIILNSISELETLTLKIRQLNKSPEMQALNKKAGVLSSDKLNYLNELLNLDNDINQKFNLVSESELKNLNLKNINPEIINYIDDLTFDKFIPKVNKELTKEMIIESINQKLGYNEKTTYTDIRNDFALKYKKALTNEEKKRIEVEAKTELSKYKKYMDRIEEEWLVMDKFINYIHFVSYLVNTLKNKDHIIGPGRGSAPSSLICYALNISEIDPIKYNLEFSRFFNKDRKDLPDIDIDLSAEVRNIVPELMSEFEFMKIQTMSNVKLITQIKNLWEIKQNNTPILNFREDMFLINELKNLIKTIENNKNLEMEVENNFFEYFQLNLKELDKLNINKYNLFMSKIKDIDEKLKNYQGTSIHASGYIILSKEQKSSLEKITTSNYNDGWETIQMSKEALESIGIQKFDLLALSYLDIIQETKRAIGDKYSNINYDAKQIENMDEKTLKTVLSLANNGNRSLFQLDSFNIQITCMKIFNEWINNKSDNKKNLLEIVSDIIAIIRPGVVQNNIDLNYIKNFDGKNSEFLNLFKNDENIYKKLKESFPLGNLIYQEDVMLVAKEFGVENSDSFRRAISKKNPKEMEEQREIFLQSALKQNNLYSKEQLNNLFDTLAKYSEYCFNKSHSISYAKILLETANLFANHPKEYLISYLNKTDKFENILNIIKEATEKGVNIKFEKLDKNVDHCCVNNKVIININKLTTSLKFDKEESLNMAIKIGQEIEKQNNWKSKILSDPMAFSQKSSRLLNSLIFENNEIPYILKNIIKQKGDYGDYYKYEFNNNKIFFDKRKFPMELNKAYNLTLNDRKILKYEDFLSNSENIPFSSFIFNQSHSVLNPLTNDFIQLNHFNKNGYLKIIGETDGIVFNLKIEEETIKKQISPIKEENTIKLF